MEDGWAVNREYHEPITLRDTIGDLDRPEMMGESLWMVVKKISRDHCLNKQWYSPLISTCLIGEGIIDTRRYSEKTSD